MLCLCIMNSEYAPPTLTIDGVVFQLINDQLSVLLIKRRNEPFKEEWALPGGYNSHGETTTEALRRILAKKTGVDIEEIGILEQLYTFDDIGRDPRGHAVSVVYMGLGRNINPGASATTEQPEFFPLTELPHLAYDHKNIIKYAHKRLSSKLTYTNAIFALLPQRFTLSQLQNAYEAVLGKKLDKRNFRKKFLALDLIKKTDGMFKEGAHRPARLYCFKDTTLKTLSRDFD
jgi:8-oxo-dGTP diphosphatase